MQKTPPVTLIQRVIPVLALLLCTCVRTVVAQTSMPLPSTAVGSSSPLIAELDGDSSNGSEIVAASADGSVTAIRADGSVLWRKELPNYSCPHTDSSDKLYPSPAVGNIFGDGVPHVVLAYGGYRGKDCDGGVIALKGSDGSVRWTFSIKAFAKKDRHFAFRHAVFGTPSLADIDGDGKLAVGFGSFDRNVYLLNHDGTLRWYYVAADTVFSSPSFADVNGDGRLEMVIGTDISQNTRIRPATKNGGYLYALRTNVKPTSRNKSFWFRDSKLVLWKTQFDQVIQSGPAVGELVASNPGPEIVFGAGCFFPQRGGPRNGRWFKVVSAKTGKVLRTLPVETCSPSLPAIADLDGDGQKEVVALVSGDPGRGGSGDTTVVAWSPDSDVVKWQSSVRVGTSRDPSAGDFHRSPSIADVDGNGSLEVVVGHSRGLAVFDAVTGEKLPCGGIACATDELKVSGRISTSPAVGDIDGDGHLDMIAGGNADGSGAVFIWRDGSRYVASQGGSLPFWFDPWPVPKGDLGRRGAVEELRGAAIPRRR